MSGIITRHFRLHNAEQFRESFSETALTRYFLYVGKNVAYANGSQIHGTVKCTTGSNTIVGTNTYFTTDLSVGDTIRITGLSNALRVHAIQSAQTLITTSQPAATIAVAANAYIRYSFSETNPTTPVDSYQETYFDIWRNMIATKRIRVVMWIGFLWLVARDGTVLQHKSSSRKSTRYALQMGAHGASRCCRIMSGECFENAAMVGQCELT